MKNTIKRTAKSVVKGVYFIMPFAIAGGVLVSLSYVIDLILGGDAIYGLGSENPVAVLLKSLGTLTFSLMLPVLASAIATDVSDKYLAP